MQIVLFLLLILAVLFVFVSKKDSLSRNIKIYIGISFALIFIIGWLFTVYNQKISQRNREVVNAYDQGKTLTCGDYKVNSQGFVFVSGTFSFVAKDSNKNAKGVVIDISTCSK